MRIFLIQAFYKFDVQDCRKPNSADIDTVVKILEDDKDYSALNQNEKDVYLRVCKEATAKFVTRPFSFKFLSVALGILVFKYYLIEQFYDLHARMKDKVLSDEEKKQETLK